MGKQTQEELKPHFWVQFFVAVTLPFAKILYVILMTGLYLFVFLAPATMAYDYIITPKILHGVDADAPFSSKSSGSKMLTARLKEKYPVGMPIEKLKHALIQDGFDRVKAGSAYFSKASFPCSSSWGVIWTEDPETQTLVSIYGSSRFSCL